MLECRAVKQLEKRAMTFDPKSLQLKKGDYIQLHEYAIALGNRHYPMPSYYLRVAHVDEDPTDRDIRLTALLLEDLVQGERAGELITFEVRTTAEIWFNNRMFSTIRIVPESDVLDFFRAQLATINRQLLDLQAQLTKIDKKRHTWMCDVDKFLPNLAHIGRA